MPEDELKDLPASHGDPATARGRAEHSAAAVASNALSAELAALAPDDLRLLKLRFADGLTVAAIARARQKTPRGFIGASSDCCRSCA